MVQKWSSSTDRLSTITASIGRPSESTEKEAENSETSWSYNTSDLRDSVIGVATTSSVPASSSKSAIAPGAYPKLESPQRTVLDRQMSAGGAFDVGRLMMAEHQGGDGALTEPLKVSSRGDQ